MFVGVVRSFCAPRALAQILALAWRREALPTGLGAEVGSMELLLAGAASAAIGFVLHALPRGEALEANAQLLAAAREGKVSTITSLVDSGLAVDAPGEHGETALMVAAGAGKSAAVELLLSIGASMTLVATEDVPGTPGLVAGGTCVHAAAAAAGGELILDTLLTRNAAAVQVSRVNTSRRPSSMAKLSTHLTPASRLP